MTLKKEISKREVNELPLFHYEGGLRLVDDPKRVEEAVERVTGETVIGFDTETRPSFRKGEKHQVSLLQMAIANEVFLFRLKHVGLPSGLIRIFEDETIVKVGIAIRDDLLELKTLRDFEERTVIDLNDFFKTRGYASFGARNLSALILGFRISKSQQTSNWDAPRLTPAQQRYAATDAYVCRQIYLKEERGHGERS